MESLLTLIRDALSDKKGENIRIIDISEISVMSDYFVIASGNNANQIQAMADNVTDVMAQNYEYNHKAIEGYDNANWVLLDYGDIVIHIFDKESREFYDLDHIWKGGKLIDL